MFDLLFHDRALKSYKRLDESHKRQINRVLDGIARDPLGSPGVKPLRGELAGLHRIRVGNYRLIIEVRVPERKVYVLAIGPRGDIYKQGFIGQNRS